MDFVHIYITHDIADIVMPTNRNLRVEALGILCVCMYIYVMLLIF